MTCVIPAAELVRELWEYSTWEKRTRKWDDGLWYAAEGSLQVLVGSFCLSIWLTIVASSANPDQFGALGKILAGTHLHCSQFRN